jgi:anthranilate synthase/aminodeoxychorismate synthase-like glutamine amidotransferase
MILLIDNYDSFTYNLVQRIGELMLAAGQAPDDQTLRVFRNDKITVDEAVALAPDYVIISPGPCTPKEGGVSNQMIETFAGKTPVFGVCLGHQCIAHSHGMTVDRHDKLMHGKTSQIYHDGKTIFDGLSNPFVATRYHSLIIKRESFDDARFEISAWTDEDEIMGIRAKPGALGQGLNAPLEGVQFHPESFLTDQGPHLLANFLGLPAPAKQTTS